MRFNLLALWLLTALLLPVGTAQAQVFNDPSSPKGQEYAIPLEKARRESSGARHHSAGSASTGRFGAGITRHGSNPKAAARKRAAARKKAKARRKQLVAGGPSGGLPSSGGGDGGGGSGLAIAAIAAAVALVGGGIALLKRHGLPGQST